jgi:hypothetical protein
MSKEPRCSDCKWWVRIHGNEVLGFSELMQGFCVKNAPVPVPTRYQYSMAARWPETYENQFCGEFTARALPDPVPVPGTTYDRG